MSQPAEILEGKCVTLEAKAAADGSIEGYASLFGEIDQGGDTVQPGAYTKSIATLAATGRRVKMLWQHDPMHPIGVWDEIKEDARGLWVKGRILTEVEKGREALALVRQGAMDGLSIGYRTINSARGAKGERLLKELDLWEVSIVTFPMQQSARIDGVKAAASDFSPGNVAQMKRDVEKLLCEAGFSNSEAKGGVAALASKIGAMREAGTGLSELAQFMRNPT